MAVFTETIKLEDQVSPAAKAAASEAKVLGSAMASVQAQMVKAEALGGNMSKSYLQLSKQSSALATALGKVDQGLLQESAAAKAADVANGKLAQQSKQSAKDQDGLNSVMADGTGAIEGYALAAGAALVGLVAGFAALVFAGAKFAIASSQAKAQMLSMFDALGEGKITGVQVDDMLDGLSSKLGQTKDTMVPLVKEFASMGITSQDALEKMTTAALSAKALAGGADSGAQAFTALSKKIQLASETGQGLKIPLKGLGSLAEMGLTVDDVARKMGVSAKVLGEQLKGGTADAKKFGDAMQNALIDKGAGPLQKMSLGAANLGAMLQQYIGDMFEDLSADVDPFMAAVKDLFSIFDSKTKPSGEALKAGIGGFFKQVFAAATKVVPLVKHFFLDLVIYGLKAYIAMKPIIGWFEALAAKQATMDVLVTAFNILGGVVAVTVAVLGGILAVIGFIAYGFVYGAVGIYNMAAALTNFIIGIGTFIGGAAVALAGWVAGAATAAYDFVAGLVAGIGNGAGQVVDAVKGLASSATGAFKGALGIHSPSKVMMGLGGHIASGAAEGIEAGSSDVHGAASGMADSAVKGATSGGSAPSGGGGGKGATITFESGSILINGAGKDVEGLTEELVSQVFQRMALESGLG